MATETVDRRAAHRRGLKVTATATIGGIAAGVVASAVASGATDRLGLIVLFAAIVAELGVMRLLGIDIEDFGAKDHLYVAFMTFSLWFISWTILLTTGATV